jgi:hypothetical protein
VQLDDNRCSPTSRPAFDVREQQIEVFDGLGVLQLAAVAVCEPEAVAYRAAQAGLHRRLSGLVRAEPHLELAILLPKNSLDCRAGEQVSHLRASIAARSCSSTQRSSVDLRVQMMSPIRKKGGAGLHFEAK